jgi:hypothetical protein
MMKKQIATFCCLMVIQSSVLVAGEPDRAVPQSSMSITHHESSNGVLRRASLSKTPWTMPSQTDWNRRQDAAPAADPDPRSWVERHPVWTGAMVGFAVGSVITYAATGGSNKDQLFDFSGLRTGAVLVFGGVSAGIGALAGWGIGRSQDDAYHDRSKTVEKRSRRSRR